jgi:hypothetical protein
MTGTCAAWATAALFASCALHRTALEENDDPSTPTTIPRSVLELAISQNPPCSLDSGEHPMSTTLTRRSVVTQEDLVLTRKAVGHLFADHAITPQRGELIT